MIRCRQCRDLRFLEVPGEQSVQQTNFVEQTSAAIFGQSRSFFHKNLVTRAGFSADIISPRASLEMQVGLRIHWTASKFPAKGLKQTSLALIHSFSFVLKSETNWQASWLPASSCSAHLARRSWVMHIVYLHLAYKNAKKFRNIFRPNANRMILFSVELQFNRKLKVKMKRESFQNNVSA